MQATSANNVPDMNPHWLSVFSCTFLEDFSFKITLNGTKSRGREEQDLLEILDLNLFTPKKSCLDLD